MTDNIIEAEITNMDTGEVINREFCIFKSGFELTTIVKIKNIESNEFPGDAPFQVSIDCLALDSIGGVFELNIDYAPRTVEERDEILADKKVDDLLVVQGGYYVTKNSITLFQPRHRPIEPEFSADMVEEVFRVNGKAEHN